MLKSMKFDVSLKQAQEIFQSIDYDGGEEITLPEFITDFNMVCATDVEELIREEHYKGQENK